MTAKVSAAPAEKMPSPAVKQEGAAIAAAAIGTFGGRSVTSWAQTGMIIGVIASVAGVALAIFTSSIFAAVGFGLLGVVSAIGIFTTQNAFDEEQLQNSITRLNQEHAFLDEQTKKMEAAGALAEQESKRFKDSEARLAARVNELEAENFRIQQANKDLEKALTDMKAVHRQLADNKEALEKRIATLEQGVQVAKGVLRDFLTTNVEFAARVGVFSSSVGGLVMAEAQIRRTIETLHTAVHTEVPNLEKFVELGNALGLYLISHVEAQREAHHKLIDEYRTEIARVERASAVLRAHAIDSEEMAKRLAEREASIQLAGQSVAKENEKLTALSAAIEKQRGELAAERERISGEIAALSATKTELVAQLEKVRETVEARIAQLEKLKAERKDLHAAGTS